MSKLKKPKWLNGALQRHLESHRHRSAMKELIRQFGPLDAARQHALVMQVG